MVSAYVLVVTEAGAISRVAAMMRDVAFVTSVYEVMGPYDILAEVAAESLPDLRNIVFDQFREIEGVRSTTTLVTIT
ncbi:MAG: Lrp/AsnC family transcriptional regulator [Dehalococcoidia bacterium]|nr:Lrp/AsnC family transcriptional regulator [Dehalococcoidia bacterium]